jgi:hypothetical protein
LLFIFFAYARNPAKLNITKTTPQVKQNQAKFTFPMHKFPEL